MDGWPEDGQQEQQQVEDGITAEEEAAAVWLLKSKTLFLFVNLCIDWMFENE